MPAEGTAFNLTRSPRAPLAPPSGHLLIDWHAAKIEPLEARFLAQSNLHFPFFLFLSASLFCSLLLLFFSFLAKLSRVVSAEVSLFSLSFLRSPQAVFS